MIFDGNLGKREGSRKAENSLKARDRHPDKLYEGKDLKAGADELASGTKT